MKKFLLGASLCLVSSPAFAQDFSGFHVEGLAGYDRADLSIDEATDSEDNTDGIFYGVGAGYDFQNRNFVLGIEGEISSSSIGDEVSIVENIDGSIYDGTVSLEDGLNWYVGGKLGTTAGANMFYAKAGFARTTVDLDLDGTVDGTPQSERVDFNFSGVRLGLGYERSFGPAFGKIEYRYTSYSDADVEYEGDAVDIEDEFGEFDLERHQIVAGVGIRF